MQDLRTLAGAAVIATTAALGGCAPPAWVPLAVGLAAAGASAIPPLVELITTVDQPAPAPPEPEKAP